VNRSRDLDPIKTREWLDSLNSVLDVDEPDKDHFLLEQAIDGARRKGAAVLYRATTSYPDLDVTRGSPRSCLTRPPIVLPAAALLGRPQAI
jgi:pyruvate dehydrogenase complex dehydrogenase (E1) component